MPIQNDDFSRFNDTDAATQAFLKTVGVAAMGLVVPDCPVGVYTDNNKGKKKKKGKGSGKVGGNLKRSHRVKLSGDHVDIGVTADYGAYVHNGTSKQKAQPWLRDSVEKNKARILERGYRAWQHEMGE